MLKPATFTILAIDDSPTQLAVLRDALEEKGYIVETARNGMEAIAKVYHAPPHLILSDVLMPELNGYHLCRLLKNDPRTAHIPIILLTNLKERHDRFWGEKAGADLYLEKAADLAPILEAVTSLLPAEAPEVRAPATRFPEQNSEDIRSRVTGILDQLLYESTISNEILKLTGLADDVDQLAREFLNFLAVLCRYHVAGLLLKDGRDKYVLCLQVVEPVTGDLVDHARRETLRAAGLNSQMQGQVRTVLLPTAGEAEQAATTELRLLHSLPIVDGEEHLATLALFGAGAERLTEGTRHALNVVADRFLIVTRYIKKLKEIEEVKGDFISMLVHDMRSPLTSIRGFTDVLAEGILGSVTEEQGGALKNIQSGCDRLLLLIEDILDLAKLEAGKMQIHPSPLALRPLTERICSDLSPLFTEKSLELRLEISGDTPWVLADGKQLARVLTNLLTNAAKFTPSGGRIIIDVEENASCPTPQFNDCVKISVTDTGPGIPPEQQKKLFGRYQQLPAARMFRKGTGLGLAICKEIISLHNGDIWVESPLDDNGGSRFSFTLPLAE